MCKYKNWIGKNSTSQRVDFKMTSEQLSDALLCASSSDSYTHTSSQNSSEDESDDPSLSVFYFESDHVALKGNRDYQAMLRTLALLESQRTQAIKDIESLNNCEKQALSDPVKFVEKLQCKIDIGLPKPVQVAPLPVIHWERYTDNVDNLTFARRKHMTRHKPEGQENAVLSSILDVNSPSTSSALSERKGTEQQHHQSQFVRGHQNQLVRGRLKDDNKSKTFNKLWTADEQRHLEELLVRFPPEAVEARRWEKIANALGNRSMQQVASRVQKYFIKLAKAGLPVPGRIPSLSGCSRKMGTHRHQRYNRFYLQPSTFMQAYQPPVYMSDMDDDGHHGDNISGGEASRSPFIDNNDVSDDDEVPEDVCQTAEYAELLKLKRLRQRRLAEDGLPRHNGYKCDQCGCEPIMGTRWHCGDCPEHTSVDFCDECMDCQFENGTHQTTHNLNPVYHVDGQRPLVDRDYTKFMQGDYNYLDPNYMPAS